MLALRWLKCRRTDYTCGIAIYLVLGANQLPGNIRYLIAGLSGLRF